MLQLTSNTLTKEALEEISKQKNEPQWLLEKRLAAFSEFERLEMPSFSHGLGINLDASEVDINEINVLNSIDPTGKPKFVEDKNIIIKDLHEALQPFSLEKKSVEIVSRLFEKTRDISSPFHWEMKIPKETKTESLIKKYFLTTKPSDKISALNQAFFTGGLFVYVPKNVEVKIPIEIISKLTQESLLETTLIIAEPFSKLTIMETQESQSKQKAYRLQNIEIFCGESSKVEFACIQNNQENTINFSSRTACLEKDASIEWNICDFGGSFTKSGVTTKLCGQGSSVNNIGIFLGRQTQQFDFSVNAIHLAPHTYSEMITKGALSGKSKSIYSGLIKIDPTGSKSSGYQKADVLLLSPEAAASPIPNLEIETNDIQKCGHGATVGQVDKEKLFYLMSRGLPEKDAIKQIVFGMLNPAIQKIKTEDMRSRLEKSIEEKLEGV